MTKKYWKKNEVPTDEGWYWCKYKRSTVVCPCIVIRLDNDTFVVRTAYNDTYTSNNLKQFGTIWFGDKIDPPEA
jgi:hypothetical protein